MVIDKFLTQFFEGVSVVPKIVHDRLSDIFLQAFPATTIYLLKWSTQFGFGNTQTVEKLEAEWQQQGSQTPHYLQTALQAAGFDLYVHQWWRAAADKRKVQMGAKEAQMGRDVAQMDGYIYPPSGYPITRNPIPFISATQPNNLLVNPMQLAIENGGIVVYEDKIYDAPAVDGTLQYYFYVGAETWPALANIPLSRKKELEKIIYKFKPCHQRCVLLIDFSVPEWQNTIDSGAEYQNTTDTGDIYQNIV